MKKLFLPALLMVILAFPLQAQAEAVHHKTPELIGVLYYADWCGSCKILDPQVKKARGKAGLDDMPIVFVRMDLTDKTTSAQSAMLASSLGLGDVYADNKGKTGYMAVVDANTKEVVARIDKTMPADDIAALIKGKL